jgi:hypothetical protein
MKRTFSNDTIAGLYNLTNQLLAPESKINGLTGASNWFVRLYKPAIVSLEKVLFI